MDTFDEEHGTDTASVVRIPWWVRLGSNAGRSAVRYATVRPDKIRALLAPYPRTATVLDLGCGKGRTLIIAAELGFRAIGVEFNPVLAVIARENLHRCGIEAEVITGDASRYQPPAGPLIVYLYNPFRAPVLRAVAQRLYARQEPTWWIYVNPYYEGHTMDWMPPLPMTTDQAALFSVGSVSLRHR